MLTCILIVCCAAFAAGCGTIAMRCTPAEARRGMPIYPATRLDVMTVRTGGGFYAYGDCDNGLGPVFGWLVAVPLSVLDIPISLVTDTVCLPMDLNRQSREESNKASEDIGAGAPNPQR